MKLIRTTKPEYLAWAEKTLRAQGATGTDLERMLSDVARHFDAFSEMGAEMQNGAPELYAELEAERVAREAGGAK